MTLKLAEIVIDFYFKNSIVPFWDIPIYIETNTNNGRTKKWTYGQLMSFIKKKKQDKLKCLK